ncbi:hypothetical protein [Candidatus Uabimicrobium amorphum]|uniref:SHOCT domain-containing protein n=1 Tax=Uabimicrobium amorphum TaxID=2596890 RepID=A0A5S9F6I6_UABAM|nr:hypothetical protein [Candidatus Uabimicrobium amorphum]BBM86644.1 hypothetical protein UABAM_05030 [Candidatus Uabimicrobium amorphum]
MIYKNDKELSVIILLIKQARFFLENPKKQMAEMPEEVEQLLSFAEGVDMGTTGAGAAGLGIGATISLAALYSAGITGLSAAGIASGLAAIGGSMLGGIAALAALPVAVGIGSALAYKWLTSESLEDKKKRLLGDLEKIQPEMKVKIKCSDKAIANQAYNFYVLIYGAMNDLRQDLGMEPLREIEQIAQRPEVSKVENEIDLANDDPKQEEIEKKSDDKNQKLVREIYPKGSLPEPDNIVNKNIGHKDKLLIEELIETQSQATEKNETPNNEQTSQNKKSLAEELRELKAIWEEDLITDEEYSAKKKQILGL